MVFNLEQVGRDRAIESDRLPGWSTAVVQERLSLLYRMMQVEYSSRIRSGFQMSTKPLLDVLI